MRYADACKHIDQFPISLITSDSDAAAKARDEIPFRALFKWADALQVLWNFIVKFQDHFLALDHAIIVEAGTPLVEQSLEKFNKYLTYFPNSHPGIPRSHLVDLRF